MKMGTITIHHWKMNYVPNNDFTYGQEMLKKLVNLRLKGYSQRHRYYHSFCKKKVGGIYLTHHAFYRWNERIGPIMTLQALNLMFASLWEEPDRLILVDQEIGTLDQDIVFTYELDRGQLVITTFYGRMSLYPALQGMTNGQRLKLPQNDMLDLKISKQLLQNQLPPQLPYVTLIFSGKRFMYKIEQYLYDPLKQVFYYGYVPESNLELKTWIYTYYASAMPIIREWEPERKNGKSIAQAMKWLQTEVKWPYEMS
ncbi:hypothetical protein IHV12_04105 [Fictibacillus sp. 7GRE50]|uniref:hypothetical protein n=1 Tax=Fictibacillus sp. 7GRE50 TaxID=2745878 RepID=UPI0018CF7B56|nr:hypothetical protein [Fictibacillus sp. 7GRE50]MBH0164083.1 hypothetical protein [Fictibacillus sp. 7GRE50]